MPLITNAFGGWLNYPEYFFFWCYHGQNAVFNTMGYQNPAMDALIDKARFDDRHAKYEAAVKGFIDIAFEEVPRVPIFQPLLERGDAEERHRLPLLVPSPARLPPAREGLT